MKPAGQSSQSLLFPWANETDSPNVEILLPYAFVLVGNVERPSGQMAQLPAIELSQLVVPLHGSVPDGGRSCIASVLPSYLPVGHIEHSVSCVAPTYPKGHVPQSLALSCLSGFEFPGSQMLSPGGHVLQVEWSFVRELSA